MDLMRKTIISPKEAYRSAQGQPMHNPNLTFLKQTLAHPGIASGIRLAFAWVWLTLGLGIVAQGQIGTGEWQDQPNLTRCQAIAAAEGAPIVLVAGETAVYSVGLDAGGEPTGEIQRYGKSNGLSRSEIVAVALAPEWGWAVVGYAEGTFDLVAIDADGTMGEVLSVRDLAEADIPGNKKPRSLAVVQDRLLVCTDIGVVEYDLEALEVRDTWKLEQSGQALGIRDAVLLDGKWWVATSSGLWSAPVDAAFPGDPATWAQDSELVALGAVDMQALAVGNDGRLAVMERKEGAADVIWVRGAEGGSWSEISAGWEEEWTGMYSDGVRLWATTPFGVMETDELWIPTVIRTSLDDYFLQPNDAAALPGGLWLANAAFGAFRLSSAQPGTAFLGPIAPNGPRSNSALRMDAWNDRLWLATGGTEASGVPLYRREGFSGRKGNYWWSVGPPEGEVGGAGVQDPMEVSIDPTQPERAVFGSLEEGLIELDGPVVAQYWNPENSPLGWNWNWEVPRCAVPALDFDRQGNLWLMNEGTEFPLKMRDAEGQWHVFEVDGFDVTTRFTRILATQSDQLWILLGDGKGIAVISTGGTPSDPVDDDIRFLNQLEGQGGLPSSFVYALEEDLDGEIWVGTLQGPAVFYQPQALFETGGFDAQQILIEQDGNFQLLLETETVWDIALDGGNRKWVATQGSGVFLLSPDGRSEVAHFTASNSPLLSDEVYDVAIDQESGMVFFATPGGVTSYRGDATNFRSELQQGGIRVFPNPWRPNVSAGVTIDGLAFGSEVHILDASGARVRMIESAGGRAIWDTLDDRGYPVPEGVYFLLAGEAAGKSGAAGKMVILR